MKNRDMFYQNSASGVINTPQMMPVYPQMQYPQVQYPYANGYAQNSSFASFGPNVVPEQNSAYTNNYNNCDEKIDAIERKISSLDKRIKALENKTLYQDNDTYII